MRLICIHIGLCCCLKHGYCKPKCHNLHDVELYFICPKNCTDKLQNFPSDHRMKVDGANFNSHDNGGHFKKSALKMATERKIYITL